MANLKILGGDCRGITLNSPPQETTRPLQILLKRRLFDKFQDFSGVEFIDLCAGSGAVGLEALSRHARKVHLVEKDLHCYKILSSNASKTCFQGKNFFLHHKSCLDFFSNWIKEYEKYSKEEKEECVLFFAPPYPDHHLYFTFLKQLMSIDKFHGVLWIEGDLEKSPGIQALSDGINGHHNILQHGQSFILFKNF